MRPSCITYWKRSTPPNSALNHFFKDSLNFYQNNVVLRSVFGIFFKCEFCAKINCPKVFCFQFYCISATVFLMPKLWCHQEIAGSSPEISQHSLRFRRIDSSIGKVVSPHFLSQHFWKTGPVGFFHLDLAQCCFQLEIFPKNGMVSGSRPSKGCQMCTGSQR